MFIEYWQYILGLGIIVSGFGSGLHFLLKYDDKYKIILDDKEGRIKANYVNNWIKNIDLIKKDKRETTDIMINDEIKKIFDTVDIFKDCRYLDDKNKNSIKYIQITIAIAGVVIAMLPVTDLLPAQISTIYFSGLITSFIFVFIAIYRKVRICEKLEEKVGLLKVKITFDTPMDEVKGDEDS